MAENVLDKLYEVTEKEIHKLVDKGSLSKDELEAATKAVCLLHKIKHFEDDGEKYGWDEDKDVSERMYPPYPMPINSYARGSNGSRNMNNSRNMHGNYTRNGYSGHDGMTADRESLVRDAQRMMDAAATDEERMAIIRYINTIGG